MSHDVTEDHETEISVAFIECHARGGVSVGGDEDVGGLEDVAEVGAASTDAHGVEDEVAPVAFFLLRLALENVDVLGIGGVHLNEAPEIFISIATIGKYNQFAAHSAMLAYSRPLYMVF